MKCLAICMVHDDCDKNASHFLQIYRLFINLTLCFEQCTFKVQKLRAAGIVCEKGLIQKKKMLCG